uniref:Uncharacterized protein n=1 Tax=Rhizophora mucronata TaxID=61149 RepID=A0A2P2P6H9_RHIMU
MYIFYFPKLFSHKDSFSIALFSLKQLLFSILWFRKCFLPLSVDWFSNLQLQFV